MTTQQDTPKAGRRRDGGWVAVYRELWTHYLPLIGKDAALYYVYLLDHRNNDASSPRYGMAWPGRNTAATALGIAKKSLQRIDALLEAVGLVEIARETIGQGPRQKIVYTVNDPLPGDEIDLGALTGNVRNLESGSVGNQGGSEGNRSGFLGNKNKKELKRTIEQERNTLATKDVASWNARDLVHYFAAKHKEVYGAEFVIVYNRDCSLIKTKLMNVFSAGKIVAIMDAAFTLYVGKWSSDRFPTPSITWLANWGVNSVLPYVRDDSSAAQPPDSTAPDIDTALL